MTGVNCTNCGRDFGVDIVDSKDPKYPMPSFCPYCGIKGQLRLFVLVPKN